MRNATRLAQLKLAKASFTSLGMTEPFISFIVPVFNTKPRYLNDLLASFRQQIETGAPCELILSDDGSTASGTIAWLSRHGTGNGVRVVKAAENGGISQATNRGIAVARGTWIGLLDHDDALAPFAAALIIDVLLNHPDCKFLYTDELIVDAYLLPLDCFLKPAWDPVLLSGVNYINHLAIYRRDRLLEIGGLRSGFEGSQDYDLVLRYTSGLEERTIMHLPYPAYLWRRDGSSYSNKFLEKATQAARRALSEHYSSTEAPVPIGEAKIGLHRIRFDQLPQEWPLVSVIIPSRDHLPLISKTIAGLLEETDYPSLEIIVVDNGSSDPEVLDLYEQYTKSSFAFRVVVSEEPFNFSRSINRGFALANGSMILLLNNDVEVISTDWLKEMVACMGYSRAGIVGAKLLYPDKTIQHAGVIVGFGHLAGHWFVGQGSDFPGPMGRLYVRQRFSAVTGACLLLSRQCAEEVGAFDEDAFAIAYNDVDYCLRAIAMGYKVLWTPFATLIHHESATRGSDMVPEQIERFRFEQKNLRQRHKTDSFDDPAISPWLSKNQANPIIMKLESLPGPR